MSETHARSRFAALRLRKSEGRHVAPRRSPAELQRLAALPVSERSAAEKEAVRNARKREKKRKQRMEVNIALAAAASAATLPAPLPQPARDSSPSLALRCESMLFSMQGQEDVLERPPALAASPAALQPAPAFAALRCPSPAAVPELIAVASCGEDCRSALIGPHIRGACHAVPIEEQRICESPVKQNSCGEGTTHLLAAAAAAIASTAPMTDPAAYGPHAHTHCIERRARGMHSIVEKKSSHIPFSAVRACSSSPPVPAIAVGAAALVAAASFSSPK
jgi:hypothetical protein